MIVRPPAPVERWAWLDALEAGAPDVVAAYRGIDAGELLERPARGPATDRPGSTESIVGQLATIVAAFGELVGGLPDEALARPGGEEDWTVAQAVGHAATSRAGLVLAASLAASGRWPADASPVVPGVPGPADADRAALVARLATSQRIVARSARAIVGHETDPCPLEHPLVGRLRCGEWVLFAGVHDLMHLDQLHRIAADPVGPA